MNSPAALSPLFLTRQLLAYRGLNAEELVRDSGLQAEDLQRLKWIPAAQFSLILRNLKRMMGTDSWGLELGQTLHHGALGAHGYAVMSAPNLREALRLVVSYNILTSPLCQFHIDERDSDVLVTLSLPVEDASVHGGLMDMAMCMVYRMLCAPFPFLRKQFRVYYRGEAPGYRKQLTQFYGKVQFNSDNYGILIPKQVYEADSGLHEPSVWKAAEQACYRQLSLLDFQDNQNIIPIVEERLNACINENRRSGIYRPLVNQAQVADYMGLKESTLRKELSDRGHSFRLLKEQCRREWLEKLLTEPELTLQAVGLILGYNEQSNFSRACRKWTGMSASELRAQIYSLA